MVLISVIVPEISLGVCLTAIYSVIKFRAAPKCGFRIISDFNFASLAYDPIANILRAPKSWLLATIIYPNEPKKPRKCDEKRKNKNPVAQKILTSGQEVRGVCPGAGRESVVGKFVKKRRKWNSEGVTDGKSGESTDETREEASRR